MQNVQLSEAQREAMVERHAKELAQVTQEHSAEKARYEADVAELEKLKD